MTPRYTVRPDVLGLWAVCEDGVAICVSPSAAVARAIAQALTFQRRALALAPQFVQMVVRAWERVN